MDATLAATGSTNSSSSINSDLIALLALGALALVVYSAVYLKERKVSATFSRIFGLIVVAVLGVGLGFSNLSDAARTAGFTLLGTIAGYLAGAKTQTAPAAGGGATAQAAPQTGPATGAVETYL